MSKMDESSIAKSGELCVEEKRFLKSSWVKRFCVLYKKTVDSHGYMELYDDQEAFSNHKKKNKKCEKRIDLHNIKSIKRTSSESSGKGNEYYIEIRSGSHKHNLMFSKESDFNDWYAKLNATADIAERGPGENSASYSADMDDYSDDGSDDEVITLNQMYASTDAAQRYEVEVESSDLAKLCDIEGKMTLLVGNNDIAFEDPKTKRVKYTFQLSWMRRFGKYKTQSFNFEVGRKCPNGEGSVTCKTPSAKLIHKTLTQKSSSRSKLVIPHSQTEDDTNKEIKSSRSTVNHVKEKESPPPVKERQLPVLTQPIVPAGMARKHPGKANTPNLIPIVRQTSVEDEALKSHPQPVMRGSKSSRQRGSGKGSPTEEKVLNPEDNGHVRQTSYKTAVNSGDFSKELEQKLHFGNDCDTEKNLDNVKKDSVKTKEDKKREKEEKKEREKREKEEKKEKERREKERKLREKEEKKSGKKDKHRDSSKSQEVAADNKRKTREHLYDEAEITPTQSSSVDDPSSLYDEAVSPVSKNPPIEYAQSVKKRGHISKTENLYEEAESTRPEKKKVIQEKVEYAEPYSRKGGIPVSQEPVMYADVQSVGKDAWKKLGRKEEEEVFEEDYSNIKSAREIVEKQEPPPLPVKNYDEEDLDENMYNTVDLKKPKSPTKAKPENLYGMASAKEVGQLPTDVLIPDADYSSDSGESLPEEEATYDDPQYEGYETQADLKKTSSKKTKIVEAYEEAVVPVKPITPKKPTIKGNSSDIYEEIS